MKVTETAHPLKNVFNSDVWLFAGKEPVVKMPIVLQGIIGLNVLVLLTSLEMPEPDVTLNVPDIMNVQITRLV